MKDCSHTRSVFDEKCPHCEIERLQAGIKAAEAFFNVICFRWPGAVEQVEEYAAPLRKALSGDSVQS